MFFVVIGGWLLSRWTYGSVVLGFVKGELKEFEDDMFKMIQSPKFKQVNNPFLNKLKDYTERIRNETKLLIAADKTKNFYKLEPSTYNTLLEQNRVFTEYAFESKIEKIPNCTNIALRSQELSRFGGGVYSRKCWIGVCLEGS